MRAIAVFAALAIFPLVMQTMDGMFYVSLASRILIYAIAATSLNLVLGYGGMVSFGHAAFFGAGAFVVIIIGGIGSIRGAFVAAIIVGLIDTIGRAFLPDLVRHFVSYSAGSSLGPSLSSMIIYMLMAAVLIFRPEGLFPAASK